MYHSINDYPKNDALTVTPYDFEQQILTLRRAGYSFVALKDILNPNQTIPKSPKITALTFDDGYLDFYENAYPILQTYNVPATLFLPTAFIGDKSRWDNEKARDIMSFEIIQSLDKNLISFGLHTHHHINYEQTNLAVILADLDKNIETMQKAGLEYLPALAYPYGKRPKDPSVKKVLFRGMNEKGIQYGLRIGNRINAKSIDKAPYEIQRIDIRGTDNLNTIMRKIRFGKLLF